mmetsp:Transcript_34802/g.72995  ORF Transcript_34802/g.72995 Transcript_34802/m.72995 type:complete len:198 (+) Transcript_34802:1270-1863(+)
MATNNNSTHCLQCQHNNSNNNNNAETPGRRNTDGGGDFWSFDVVHAYGGQSPSGVYESMGFTVRSGTTWLKSTPPAIALVRRIVEACGAMCDDNLLLNEMIASRTALGIEWNGGGGDEADDDEAGGGGESTAASVVATGPSRAKSSHGSFSVRHRHRRARTGRSSVTGHRVKIWDRDLVSAVVAGDPGGAGANTSNT